MQPSSTVRDASPFGRIRWRAPLVAEALLLCLPCAFAIQDWLSHLYLSRDSADYIAAASNLVSRGRLALFVNFTDWVTPPTLMPYLEKPPGLPLLLAPFIAILRDPMIAAVVAQAAYLVCFYLAIYFVMRRLGLSLPLRAAALILFTVVEPFRWIHQYFWSETLFIALSIAAAFFAVGLVREPSRRRDWIPFLLLLALSATVRYTGAANLALITPVLFQRETMRGAWRSLTHRRALITALVAGGVLVALSLSADQWGGGRPGIGPIQWVGILLGAAGLLVGLVGLVLTRKRAPSGARPGSEGTRPDAAGPNAHTWALLAAVAAIAPPLIWWARNRFLYGVFSLVTGPFEIFQAFKLWVPFGYVWNDLLDVGRYQRPLLGVLAAFLLLLPVLRKPPSRTSEVRRTAQIVLLSAAAAHFAVVWSLSLVATVEAIGARYFSPVLAFLLLGILNGLPQAAELARPKILRQVVSALPLVLIAVAAMMDPTAFLPSIGPVNYPRERELWRDIDRIEWTRASSHFYSDDAYSADGLLHQIFSGRPQGIIWDRNILRDPEILRHILSDGVDPFILVTDSGDEAGILDEMSASGVVPLERILFEDTGFALYHLRR